MIIVSSLHLLFFAWGAKCHLINEILVVAYIESRLSLQQAKSKLVTLLSWLEGRNLSIIFFRFEPIISNLDTDSVIVATF